MHWLATSPDDGTWYLGFPKLPRRLAEALFPPRIMRPDSRVLLVGSTTRLMTWMDWLGLQADLLPEVTPEACSRLPEAAFDIVLVQSLPQHFPSLCGTESLQATAELLAHVRPGGRLVVLGRSEPTWNQFPTGHLRSCYARHLGCFDGLCQVYYFGDPWTNWKTWNWMVGLQPRSGFIAASLTIPEQPMERTYWTSAAQREAHRTVGECCLWSRRKVESETPSTRKRPAA